METDQLHSKLKKALLAADPEADGFVIEFIHQHDVEEVRQKMTSLAIHAEWSPVGWVNDFKPQTKSLPALTAEELTVLERFWTAFAPDVFAVLGFYSLPYCFLSANGAKTLWHSGRFKQSAVQRLEETGHFVRLVVEQTLQHGQPDLALLKQIRLLHAFARFWAAKHQQDYVAINQTELLGTGLSFGMIVLRGLRKAGHALPGEWAQVWHKLWNLVTIGMGVAPALIPGSLKQAWVVEQHIRKLCFEPGPEGKQLASILVDSLAALQPYHVPGLGVEGLVAYFLGEADASMLGLNASSILPRVQLGMLSAQLAKYYQAVSK